MPLTQLLMLMLILLLQQPVTSNSPVPLYSAILPYSILTPFPWHVLQSTPDDLEKTGISLALQSFKVNACLQGALG